MNERTPGWELLHTFLMVVEEHSLSGAARALGCTQPTVGRRMDALEDALGQPLFVRSRHGLAPTEAALDLVPHADAMAAASAALVRAASGRGEDVAATLRLTASDVIGAEVLPAILGRFREDHSQIQIELALSNDTQDLHRREADVAVRMVRPTQAALVARRIGDTPVGLYAHRRYADRHGLPKALEELTSHTLIGPDRTLAPLQFLKASGLPIGPDTFQIRCDNDLAQLGLIRAGSGIGGVQARIADPDPDLLPVLPAQVSIPLEMWLVMHEDLRTHRPTRLLFDHLVSGLTAFVQGRVAEPLP
jgi:DNA-binding transcriptional LysR family regulator